MTSSYDREPAVRHSRLRVAQLLAFVALVAALVGALGPAERVRTSYSWPPATLPEEQPERLWYTPLPLITHRPEAVQATVPCALPPALPDAARHVTVLATARDPRRAGGLAIVESSGRLTISLGQRVLDRVVLPASAAADASCSYRLGLEAGMWSLSGGPADIARGGVLDEVPVVFGLFSAVDLRSGTPPAIEVRTAVHATRTVTRQVVAWSMSAVGVLAALLLVSLGRRPRPLVALRRGFWMARAGARPVDALVAVTLLGWWVLGPAFFDDGWVIARQGAFAESGGFSAYYNTFAANSPLSYGLDWALHWLSDSTARLLVLRAPSLLCLAAMWMLCRWTLARILPASKSRIDVVLWSAAAAYLAGALAWGMTLRTEPVTALLVTAIVACIFRFVERGTAGPVAAMAVIVPFAITGHPAGIVAFAPLLAAAPALWRWARVSPASASTIVSSGVALFGLLVFVGSDLEQRRADTETTAAYGLTTAWRFELVRYTSLADPLWGTPLRRASVALIALAVLAFLVRRRRSRNPLDLPSTALAISLVLFIATPSKHPWHFGALLGLAALAVAAETARFRSEAATTGGWHARPLLAIAAASLAIAWAWAPRHQWNALDLRTLDWAPSFESSLELGTLAALTPFVVVAAAAARELVRGRRDLLQAVPWRIAAWTAPLLAFPLVVFTLAVLAADTAKTDSWTLGRQNLGALTADGGCGLADNLRVAIPGSARPLTAVGARRAPSSLPAWVPSPPLDGLPRFALGPSDEELATTPWFELPGRPVGLFVSGSPGESDLELVWGRAKGGRIEELDTAPVAPGFAVDEGTEVLPWRLVAGREGLEPPSGADRVRVRVRRVVAPGAAIAVSAPVTYSEEPIAPRLDGRSSPTLLLPNIVTYFPCGRLPELSRGVVEVPRHVVATRDGAWVLRDRETSPFVGVLDLYRLERLPIVDTRDRPGDVLEVLAVDERIPGAAQVPPETTTLVS